MPCSYRIIPEHSLIWNRFYGTLTRDEVLQLSHDLRADPKFDPNYAVLQDLRLLEGDQVDFLKMMRITDDIKSFRAKIGVPLRMVFVAPNDVIFGTARMFESLANVPDLIEVVVFHGMDEAAEYLGIPPDSALLQDGHFSGERNP